MDQGLLESLYYGVENKDSEKKKTFPMPTVNRKVKTGNGLGGGFWVFPTLRWHAFQHAGDIATSHHIVSGFKTQK